MAIELRLVGGLETRLEEFTREEEANGRHEHQTLLLHLVAERMATVRFHRVLRLVKHQKTEGVVRMRNERPLLIE
jgi:hypothetical protein